MKKISLLIFAIYLTCFSMVYSKTAPGDVDAITPSLNSDNKINNCTEEIPAEEIVKAEQEISEDETGITLEEELDNNADAIYLNLSDTPKTKEKINSIPEKKIDSLNDYNSFRISPQNIPQYANNDIYSKKTKSFIKEKKHKNITFGTKYDNTFLPNQMEQSRTLFTKYEKNNFTFGTSYKNNSLSSFDQQFKGTFSFSPEYKINKHLSLQGIYSKNFMDRSNKNEVIFTLKPFKDDRMDFNVGAGQIYYEDTTPARSQFNFATKIKF